jgi:hypothetical protein
MPQQLMAQEFGVERVQGSWYARDVFALLAHPDISSDLRAELDAWARCNDENAGTHRPFVVDPDGYSFDGAFRATHGAPAWWVAAWTEWAMRNKSRLMPRDERFLASL